MDVRTLYTITTIELSNICNLSCSYCINRFMQTKAHRAPTIMSDEVFERSLYWLRQLVEQGTQQEVNVNGNGESTLDPQLPERISKVIAVVGEQNVQFCTNGMALTNSLVRELKATGIHRIDVSVHNAYHARKAVDLLQRYNIPGVLAAGAIVSPHNWVGQLEPEHEVNMDITPHIYCHPLIQGRGYIQAEGAVTPCCYDYRNLGVFGTVFDDDLMERPIVPYELCESCHQEIPKEFIQQYDWKVKQRAYPNNHECRDEQYLR